MKKLNLFALSSTELQQLKTDIDKELSNRSSKLQAIEEVKSLAASKGLKLEELLAELSGSKTKTRRELGPAPIRFRHPQNPSLTWSGRGKSPNWMKEAIEKGFTEDQMRV
jgi:DNA-binding protein H-NS